MKKKSTQKSQNEKNFKYVKFISKGYSTTNANAQVPRGKQHF